MAASTVYYIGIPKTTPQYTPTRMSVPKTTYSTSVTISEGALSDTILYSGVTYKLIPISTNVSYYQSSYINYIWLHNENRSANRASSTDYGDVTTTVKVWEYSGDYLSTNNYTNSVTDLASDKYIYLFDAPGTYSPVTTVNVTLHKNGGSGGDNGTWIAPGTTASNYPTLGSVPTRSGFTFLGFFDAQSGGTQYYTASATGARTFDKTSDCTLYAHWRPIINENYNDASIYCTTTAEAYSKMRITDDVQIAGLSPSGPSGTTVQASVTSPSGWTLTSDKKGVNVPKDTAAGNYTVRIELSIPAGTINGYTHESASDIASCVVTVKSTSISSYGNPTVSHTTPVPLDNTGQTYTMSPTFSQTATWNNGATSTITTGGSYTYAVQTSKTGYSLGTGSNSNKVTVTNNTSTSARNGFVVRITCTVNSKSGTKDVTFNQPAGEMVYGTPVVSHTTPISLNKAGETYTMSPTFSQTYTWNGVAGSGGTITTGGTYTYAVKTSKTGYSLSSNQVTVTNNKTTSTRNGFVVTITCTVNGESGTKDVTFNQPAGSKVYGNPTVSHTTPVSLNKAGQTYTMSPTFSQTYTWNGVSGSGGTITTGGSYTYEVQSSKTGYSLSSNKVTVTNNTTTSTRNGFVVRITCTANSKSGTKDVTFNQPAGSRVYDTPEINSFTYSDFVAAGQSKLPSVTYEQDWTWNGVSGSGGTSTSGGTLAFTTTGTLPDGFDTDSDYSTTGRVTWEDRGTTTGAARDAYNNLLVSVQMNGKTSSSFTCTKCKQVANSVTSLSFDSNTYVIEGGQPATCVVTATYTSLSTRDVSSDPDTVYTLNPTGIANVVK